MIEIKMTGMCENCDKADLKIDCVEIARGYETMKHWSIRCIHHDACVRMSEKHDSYKGVTT